MQIFVKNQEGEIIKGMPIRVTKAHSLKIVAYPNPDSKQLTLDNVYEIKVEIYDKNENLVYPSTVSIPFLIKHLFHWKKSLPDFMIPTFIL